MTTAEVIEKQGEVIGTLCDIIDGLWLELAMHMDDPESLPAMDDIDSAAKSLAALDGEGAVSWS